MEDEGAARWSAKSDDDEKPFDGLEPLKDTKIASAQGISAIALHLALKYHDTQMVKDGALYQQYKLEGKNIVPLHLDMVLDTAKKLEVHLLGASERIAKLVIEALVEPQKEETNERQEGGLPDPTSTAVDRDEC